MAQTRRRARPKKPKEPRYVVHCGDVWQMFKFGGLWKLSHLENKFNEFLAKIDFVPGLVLRDAEGNLFKPKLQVCLEPVAPEES